MNYSLKWLKVRILSILLLFIIIFSAIFFRAYQIQVSKRSIFENYSKKQTNKFIKINPKRGSIYDRNYKELAISTKSYSVYAQSRSIKNKDFVARQLAKILQLRHGGIKDKLNSKKNFVYINRKISIEKAKKIEKMNISGIGLIPETKRWYPNKELASQVIGFAGTDNIGLEGLELKYEGSLQGKHGSYAFIRDAMGNSIFSNELKYSEPEDGYDLVLTLDSNIQYIVEKELQKTVKKYKAKSGTVVVMKPQTGEILAMASWPSYNPNIPGKSKAQYKKIRAINDCFEPGSIFKVFLLASTLEDKIITPQDIFFCENGHFRYGGSVINDVHKYKWLPVNKIIAYSSNIGAAKIGEKLRKERLYYYIKKFGFGDRTGIDLPGEACGIVHSPSKWSKIRLATISFGQGISTTSIQVAAALSAVANGGVLMKPQLVKEIREKNGNIIKEFPPKKIRTVLSPHTCELVKRILEEVVEPEATGPNAAISDYPVAGKTGTAQKVDRTTGTYSSSKYTSSFIGFVPASHPEIVISVIIDEPEGLGYGGVVAAPLFSSIGRQTLVYLGILPTKPSRINKKRVLMTKIEKKKTSKLKIVKDNKKFLMPDFTGMTKRQVLRTIDKYKIEVKITGSGTVIGQNPPPGGYLPKDRAGWIILRPPV